MSVCRKCHKLRANNGANEFDVRRLARLCARNESPKNLANLRRAQDQLAASRQRLTDHQAECV